MKKVMVNKIIILSSLLLLLACVSKQDQVVKEYTCPMHPEIIKNEPGQCPICGMDLVERAMSDPLSDTLVKSSLTINDLLKPVNSYVLSDINVVAPVLSSIETVSDFSGYVNFDRDRIYDISARYSGWIKKLNAKYKYQKIEKGQVLYSIYSHEIEAALKEYHQIIINDSGNVSLLRASKQKLALLGVHQSQLSKIHAKNHQDALVTVYSDHSGFLLDLENLQNTTINPENTMNQGMMNMRSASPIPSIDPITISEGDFVNKGQTIFRVADISRVWVEFEIKVDQLQYIKINQPIEIFNNEQKVSATINFIEPFTNSNTPTVKARAVIDNAKGDWFIGQLVNIQLKHSHQGVLAVPKAAVLDLGKDKVVFVNKDGVFKVKQVITGVESGTLIEIHSGLSEKDEIAMNAQYLVDSDGFVKEIK